MGLRATRPAQVRQPAGCLVGATSTWNSAGLDPCDDPRHRKSNVSGERRGPQAVRRNAFRVVPGFRIRFAGRRLDRMAEIVLTTLNAKYAHAAFGLRYLLANLGPLQQRAEIVEFDVSQRPVDML